MGGRKLTFWERAEWEIKYKLRPVSKLTGNKLGDIHRKKAHKLFWLRDTLSGNVREWVKETWIAMFCEEHGIEPSEIMIEVWMKWWDDLGVRTNKMIYGNWGSYAKPSISPGFLTQYCVS